MGKIKETYYKFYFKSYLNSHKRQLKKIDELDYIPNTFLVISNTAFGDTLLSTPAIRSLKESFPNSKIVALLNENITPLFETYEYIDKVIKFKGGFKDFKQTINEIKMEKPEISLIFHGNGPQDIYISVLSGCNFILKHPNSSPLKKYLSYDFEKKEQHTIEDRLDLVRLIGGKVIYKEMNLRKFENVNFFSKFENLKNAIAFQIGAADVYKMWPIENFISLAKQILEYDKDLKIVITGIKSEFELAQKIVISCGNRVFNMCGKCSINELPYLIQNMKLLVTNDTGTMHLAIALKVSTISLFSPTSSKGIGPYQDLNLHKVIQKDGSYMQKLPKKKRSNEAMYLIKTEEVFDAYKKVIN